jgi:hypothetical protein
MKHHSGAFSFSFLFEWLVIALIAVYVVPHVIQMVFSGVSELGVSSKRTWLDGDPFAAADAELVNAIHKVVQ